MTEARIVLVDGDQSSRKSLKGMLTKLGYWVVGEAADGLGGIRVVRARQPDLVIADASVLGAGGFELAEVLREDKLAPLVMVAESHAQGLLEKARRARASSLLLKPVDEQALYWAVELAIINYQEIIQLENQIKELKEKLETRKLVERAKGILMETLGISEAEAYRRMQKQSMDKRVSMRQIAEAIILAHNLKS
ncbi:ANTAR domain-containing response regulator [Desulfovirgula thermocuniculi]|uniref:ANTAR domain-containing response regulator n=1 Tax=Desulfovirgula thermocuniculi TaxID=348842 RepID=UPI00047F23D2|nr:ANTAR domain-containing protein [Desulfovirgula thermocuniculi]